MAETAFRAVRSRRKFNKSKEIMDAVAASIDAEVKPHLIKQFDEIVADWKHKPEFKARKFITSDHIKVSIYPAGQNKQIYTWVTEGTKGPYPIPKRGPGYLAFQLGYQPRTKPGKPPSWGGPGRASGPWVRGVMQVMHPGIKARKFEAWVKEDQKAWFSRTMENIWRRAIRAA